ncbi:MAG: restriction endonuclease subunit S, partial [Opitutaceae bacterium]|nr:restriction endonuclease subunit S [Opitutaceae bacterium]
MCEKNSSDLQSASEPLPLGWTLTTLGEICALNPKLPTKPKPDSQVTFVPMAAVCEYTGAIVAPQSKTFSSVSKGYTPFIEGDVLWAKITPCMENGKAAIARNLINGIGAGSTEFFVLRSKGRILPEYIYRFMRQETFRGAARKTMNSAVGQARVPKEFLLSHPIPLPPLPEQRRIVARLETLEARSRRARAKLEEVPAQLAQARQSLLGAAFKGDLTATEFPKRFLGECGKLARGVSKHRPRGDERLFGNEYPFIQTGEVANSGGRIRSATKYYSKFGLNQSRLFPVGTVCVTIAANIGDSAILEIPACFPDSVVGFTPNPTLIMSEWAEFYFRVIRGELAALAPATAQKNINLSILEEIQIPLPSLHEQQKIVRRLSAAFARLDAAASAHAAAVAAL